MLRILSIIKLIAGIYNCYLHVYIMQQDIVVMSFFCVRVQIKVIIYTFYNLKMVDYHAQKFTKKKKKIEIAMISVPINKYTI